MTSFQTGEFNVTIDFERPAGRWVLLVIDDKWNSVKRMVLGANGTPGLQERCVERDTVKAYWADRRKGHPEPFLNALLLLVPLAWEQASISKIVFSAFPPYLTPDDVARAVTGSQHVAAMLDAHSDLGAEDQHGMLLESSWSLLEQVKACPRWARVILSRAFEADAHERIFRNVPLLSKHLAGKDEFEGAFEQWWASVEGDLRTGYWAFSACTGGKVTHEARTLLRAEESAILHVLSVMQPLDSFGVWSWCKEALPEHGLELQRRWFAAKVFQEGGALGSTMPIVGLIALVNGTRMAHLHDTDSFTEGKEGISVRNISSQDIASVNRECLGVVDLGERKCQEFAQSLRAWLLHPEQFVGENSRATAVTIRVLNGRLCITIGYSIPLPAALLSEHRNDRPIGSARETLNKLLSFFKSCKTNESCNSLELCF